MEPKDLKSEVMELAKARGLEVVEDTAGAMAELALDVVGKIISMSENKYDDMIWQAVEGKAREALSELVDKIDGKEG